MAMAAPWGLAALVGQVVLVALFSLAAYRKGWLTVSAAAVAFGLGAAIVLSTDFLWLIVLVSLLAYTALATRFRYREKEQRGVAEGRGGARRIRNVLANGLVPAGIAVLAPFMPALGGQVDWGHVAALTYVSAVASAAADTLASEVGSLSDRAYMITTLRRVPPGTDGGVSLAGQGAALLGAGLIAGTGAVMLGLVSPWLWPAFSLQPGLLAVAVPIAAGFAGCQVDSLFGATLEIRGFINKEEVNLLGITSGAVVGFALGVVL